MQVPERLGNLPGIVYFTYDRIGFIIIAPVLPPFDPLLERFGQAIRQQEIPAAAGRTKGRRALPGTSPQRENAGMMLEGRQVLGFHDNVRGGIFKVLGTRGRSIAVVVIGSGGGEERGLEVFQSVPSRWGGHDLVP